MSIPLKVCSYFFDQFIDHYLFEYSLVFSEVLKTLKDRAKEQQDIGNNNDPEIIIFQDPGKRKDNTKNRKDQ